MKRVKKMARRGNNVLMSVVVATILLTSIVVVANFHFFKGLDGPAFSTSSVSSLSKTDNDLRSVLENQDLTITVMREEIEMLVKKLNEDVDNGVTEAHKGGYDSQPCAVPGVDSEAAKRKQEELSIAQAEIISLKSQLLSAESRSKVLTQSPPQGGNGDHIQHSAHYDKCDETFGKGLVDNYMKDPVIICDGGASKITCYTHKQFHKQELDMFCVGTEITIDFSKVKGEHSNKKPPRGNGQYHSFDHHSVSASCKKTPQFNTVRFMPHMTLQMNSFVDDVDNPTNSRRSEKSTYLLARDEDMENAFHSSADFINMELVYQGLGLSKQSTDIVLFDKNPDGPFFELIQNAFTTPSSPLKRAKDFKGETVTFKKVVWHLESPAGIVFPKVADNSGLGCRDGFLFHKYRERVLRGFDLWDVPPPSVPSLTLIPRYRTAEKNVGRVLANEKEVVSVMEECVLCDVRVADLGSMTFREQLKTIRGSNVIVGVHGAGLMNILFAPEEAVLLEMHPNYRLDRHFRHAARMSGKNYMPLRSTQQVTCQGSSDNVPIPIGDFRNAIDGAVRLARSFDDGLSECGLVCNLDVLALDAKHDGDFKRLGIVKPSNPKPRFPCH